MHKKLYLLFNGRFPSEKAAALFAAKSAEAFAGEGYEVTVVVPERGNANSDPYVAYGIAQVFQTVRVPVVDAFALPLPRSIAFWLTNVSFARAAARYLAHYAPADAVIYSNELLPLTLAARHFPAAFYELHDFPEKGRLVFARMLRPFAGTIVHNQWKYDELLKLVPHVRERILLERNAVDVNAFHLQLTKEEARQRVGLPKDMHIVVYTGHLYGWKGVDTLAEAAALLPSNFLVVVVGGTPEDIERFSTAHANVDCLRIVGHRPHAEMPLWQAAADILVLPNTARERISALYTSPMKLFEYMASERPIVASDVPSIRELVSEAEAMLVAPDSAEALAAAIVGVTDEPGRVARAYAKVQEHTWAKRARRILRFIESKRR